MSDKPPISTRDTYVLDPDEISQLDELSLTSVMRQVPDPLEQSEQERGGTEPTTTAAISGESIINELLKDPEPTMDRPGAAASPETGDDLIAPEILVPEGTDDKDA